MYDVPRRVLTRLTFEGGNHRPVLTPDGQRVIFASDKAGPRNLFWKAADGSGPEERLTNSPNPQFPTSCSPDGKLLVFDEINPTSRSDIWVLPLEGDSPRRARPFLQTSFEERGAVFSADGRWLAYQSNESGKNEVYVQPFPGAGVGAGLAPPGGAASGAPTTPGGKWQISTEGGTEPVWAGNGRELFYRNGNKMMAVAVSLQPTFKATTPRLLFEGAYEFAPVGPSYDVSRDGQRFVMVKEAGQQAGPAHVTLVLNWTEELKRASRSVGGK